MRKLFIFAVLLLATPLMGEDLYFSQTGGGAGTSCGSAFSAANFNSAGYWGAGAGKISAGDTAHLCGTITSQLTAQGDGSAGSPITILFETGAKISEPVCSYYGCFVLSGRSYITVDGGTNGIIESTANGSALANQAVSFGLVATSTNHITVQNLTFQNMYVQVLGSATLGDSSTVRDINFTGSNWLINHNVFHDSGWSLVDFFANGDTNVTISNNNFYAVGHGIAVATSGANALTNLYIYGNSIHDVSNWADTGCDYHDDGVHVFGTAGSSIDNVFMYNNYFYGNWGTCPTGFIFIEGQGSTPANMINSDIFNNVAIVGAGSAENTNGWFVQTSGATGNQRIYNNTVIGLNATDNALCFNMGYLANLYFENNNISSCGDPVRIDSSTLRAVDYNFYGPSCSNGGNCFIWNGSFTGSFSAWKTATSAESHSVQNNTPLLNANGSPQASSPVIGIATNLTSLGITPLNSDFLAVARPATGAWDAGAYQYAAGGAPAVGLSTASINFGNQVVSTTSGSQSVTVTNTGTATLNISSITLTGTNSADFAKTTTCGATLTAGNNCSISVTFTPLALGARSAAVTITDNASDNPQAVTLGGTGIAVATIAAPSRLSVIM